MLNQIAIMGRLVRDPEARQAGSHIIYSFSIANDDGFGDKKKTSFFNCQAWNKTGENLAKFFHKGDMIILSGKVNIDSYTDKDGNRKEKTVITVNGWDFCGNGNKSGGNASSGGFLAEGLNAADANIDRAAPVEYTAYEDAGQLPF